MKPRAPQMLGGFKRGELPIFHLLGMIRQANAAPASANTAPPPAHLGTILSGGGWRKASTAASRASDKPGPGEAAAPPHRASYESLLIQVA